MLRFPSRLVLAVLPALLPLLIAACGTEGSDDPPEDYSVICDGPLEMPGTDWTSKVGMCASDPVLSAGGGSTVFIGSLEGLNAFKAATGGAHWTLKEIGSCGRISVGPSGRVFAPNGDDVAAVTSGGEIVWTAEVGFSSRVDAAGALAVVVVPAWDPEPVHVLSASSGALLWKSPGGKPIGGATMTDGAVIIVEKEEDPLANSSLVTARAITGGDLLWNAEVGALADRPLVSSGKLFVAANGALHALNIEDGSELWAFSPPGVVGDYAIGSDGTIYIPTWQGRIHAVAPDSGKELWTFDLADNGGDQWIKSVVEVPGNGALVANLDDGTVIAVSTHFGTEFWRSPMNLHEYGLMVASSDNAVFGRTEFDNLVKFRPGDDASVPPGFECAPCSTGCLSEDQPSRCLGTGTWDRAGMAACMSNETCQEGECIVCEPHYGVVCVDGDPHWVDSCDRPEEKKETCQAGEDCLFGVCCSSHDHKGCSSNDVYWFDGCGGKEDLVQECGSGKDCEAGLCVAEKPDHCSCMCSCSWCTSSVTCDGDGCGSCYSICVESCTGNPNCGSYSSHSGSCS